MQFLGGALLACVVTAGLWVVKAPGVHCGLEGSATTHSSAATSQLEMTSPLGSMQSSAVLLVQVPGGRRGVTRP